MPAAEDQHDAERVRFRRKQVKKREVTQQTDLSSLERKEQLLEHRLYANGTDKSLMGSLLSVETDSKTPMAIPKLNLKDIGGGGAGLFPRRPERKAKLTPRSARLPKTRPKQPNLVKPLTSRDRFYVNKRLKKLSDSVQVEKPCTPIAAFEEEAPIAQLPINKLETNQQHGEEKPNRRLLLQPSSQYKTFMENVEEDIRKNGTIYAEKDSFLYLTPTESGNPYKLMVIDHSKIDPNNYYTLSKVGISHFVEGIPEFTYIEKFEREYYMFSLLKQLPFFLKFRMWKQFLVWKKNICASKRRHCQLNLENNLFILHAHMRMPLQQLRTLCYNVGSLKLYNVDLKTTYTLDQFCGMQVQQSKQCDVKLNSFLEKAFSITKSACEIHLINFLEEKGFASNAGDCLNEEGRNQKREVTFTERAGIRSQCRRLTKFIRLVDFFIIDTFLSIVMASTENFLSNIKCRQLGFIKNENLDTNKIRNEDEHCMALFEIDITLFQASSRKYSIYSSTDEMNLDSEEQFVRDSELHFLPNEETTRSKVETIIYDGLKIVACKERLLSNKSLIEAYVQASIDEVGPLGDGLDLDVMIVEDSRFQAMVDELNLILKSEFQKASNKLDLFIPFKDQYKKNASFLKQLSIENYRNSSIEEFRNLLSEYSEQQEKFKVLPDKTNTGIIQLNSCHINTILKPSPIRCLQSLHELVPLIAQEKNTLLLTEFSTANSKISITPLSVGEFSDILSFFRSLQLEQERFDQSYLFLKEIYSLTDEFNIKVSDIDRTNAFMLGQSKHQLTTAMEILDDRTQEYTEKFGKELNSCLPALEKSMKDLATKLNLNIISSLDSEPDEVLKYLNEVGIELNEISELADKYSSYQSILCLLVSEFTEISDLQKDLDMKLQLWEARSEWTSLLNAWGAMYLKDLDTSKIDENVEKYYSLIVRCERALPGNLVVKNLRLNIEELRQTVPIIVDLRCDVLQERHWSEISNILKMEINSQPEIKLIEFMEMQLTESASAINRIITEAKQECYLEEMLGRVISTWNTQEFDVVNHKEQKDVYVLTSLEEIIILLEENLLTVNTILSSRFVTAIRSSVDEWHQKLLIFQECLDEWMSCQRDWIYLENIFHAPDIQRQLPKESKLFAIVDSSWKELMKRTSENPNCLVGALGNGVLDLLLSNNEHLATIQKSLEDYLETKRLAFPRYHMHLATTSKLILDVLRFYFLSNDELLEILAHSKDPQAVQPHLRKCFDALYNLEFQGPTDIIGMRSSENEYVPLGRNLKARGNVEDWLLSVQNHMINSLYKLMKNALVEYDQTVRSEWIFQHPAQCIATVAQMIWVRSTEKCLLSNKSQIDLKEWFDLNVKQLSTLSSLVCSKLSQLERKVVVALITTDVHARDIIEDLIMQKVDSITSFSWKQQLRYYWDVEVDNTVVNQSNSSINYGYEYMGASSRLVITPLTDRCWMTITGAFDLKLGASPSGPAGTGKTESSKDLAKALGIQCIVFNCSDQIDYQIIGKLLSGLAQCGCWTCLDEFNRIDIEVLSVIAQQLSILRQGRLSQLSKICFEGKQMTLNDHHVIVTMNPGYAGRTELPDNLKVCFRPVAMMVPDYALIAEIMLFAEGFDDAKRLSRKMTKLYKLCSEQLSQQPHYDFGMRAVKSVLVMAGALKRSSTELTEEIVLIKAMQDANLPKFVGNDVPLFHAIVTDLFPVVEIPVNNFGILEKQIFIQMEKDGLQNVENLNQKILELYLTFNVRFGVALTGHTCSGKTTCYNTLKKCLTTLREEMNHPSELFQSVNSSVLNPKCISMGELYGHFSANTNEWKDGLVSSILRESVSIHNSLESSKAFHWVVFDGPVDALWIENMNTVLDDNMMLCLANGERIKLYSQMRMLFEVQDLCVASPATVSRLGVVHMTPEHIGWRPLARTWLNHCIFSFPSSKTQGDSIDSDQESIKQMRSRIWSYLDALVDLGLSFLRSKCKEPIPTCDLNLVSSLCDLFQILLVCEESQTSCQSLDDHLKKIDIIFMFSFVWSIGGSLCMETHMLQFDEFCRQLFDEKMSCCVERKSPLPVIESSLNYYDVFIDFESMSFVSWDTIVPTFKMEKSTPFFKLMVPTCDTIKYSYLLSFLTKSMKPAFLTGSSGTGKTAIIHNVLNRLQKNPSTQFEVRQVNNFENSNEGDKEKPNSSRSQLKIEAAGSVLKFSMIPICFNFSAQTSSSTTQITIESKLEKKRKNLLGAPAKTKMIVFVDDVNMPMVEEYGSQPPIELLRQILDHNGVFDREKLFWKKICDTVLVLSAAPPVGGRNKMTPRFTRHFHTLVISAGKESTMKLIFSSIMQEHVRLHFKNNKSSMMNDLPKLVDATIAIYESVSTELLPTPSKCHYTFNLRDLSKVFQGYLTANSSVWKSRDLLLELFIHENMRVFYDRLVDIDDQCWFNGLVETICQNTFRMNKPNASANQNSQIIFGNYGKLGCEVPLRVYERIDTSDMKKVGILFDSYLEDYNLLHFPGLKLVFFEDCIIHLSALCRILSQPRGNAMLVGVGGSGKRSLVKLASAISEYECFQIQITSNYNEADFREDLKKLLWKAGVDGKRITFLFTDGEILYDSFLEDINNLLNSGEVPNLFPPDEYDKIINEIRDIENSQQQLLSRESECPSAGEDTRNNDIGLESISRVECELRFMSRVRNYLHIVLCMSPVGDSFRVLCRQFPSMVNCTTINWFNKWPHSALMDVANYYLQNSEFSDGASNSNANKKLILREAISTVCVEVHTSLFEVSAKFWTEQKRRVYTTPKSYLDLLQLYIKMYSEKRNVMNSRIRILSNGIVKLEETNKLVSGLKVELTELQPILSQKAQEAETLLKQVAMDQKAASLVQERVAHDEKIVKDRAIEVGEAKNEAQSDLDKALPAFNLAVEALDSLDKKYITEVRSFTKPPPIVQLVMEAVCILLGEKADWETSKKILTRSTFMQELKEYDKDNISATVLKKIKKYVTNPSMAVEEVKKVSNAASSICMWVHAMDVYATISKEVGPKRERLEKMNKELAEANEILMGKQKELKAVMKRVNLLQGKCDMTISDKRRLTYEANRTHERLQRAEKLTTGLADEHIRWIASVENLRERASFLVGDVFLSAASISYMGPFTGPFRKLLTSIWQQAILKQAVIPCSTNSSYSLINVSGDPATILEWYEQGLPTDIVSSENGVMISRTTRWPLLIDPQQQAVKWLKKMEKLNGLTSLRMKQPRSSFNAALENSIRDGFPVLIEDIDESIDPSLNTILLKAVNKQGDILLLRYGDKEITYNPNFKLYLATTLPNPHYLPEICIKVNLINFTVTTDGLEDQLLGDVVCKERPDVESKMSNLVSSIAVDKKLLQGIEDKILNLLSESTGNILDDQELINTLAESKITSGVISERLVESEVTQAEIRDARNKYRSVATRGSILFFILSDLARIDPMYQYSLEYFCKLFKNCMNEAPTSNNVVKRLDNLISFLTWSVYKTVSRGLFENHKLLLSFLICTRIKRESGDIPQEEWVLLQSTSGFQTETELDCEASILSNTEYSSIEYLCNQIPMFKDTLLNSILNKEDEWRSWIQSNNIFNTSLPDSTLASGCTLFQKLLLIKYLREDQFLESTKKYIAAELGEKFVQPVISNMEEIFADLDKATPCIFILSSGADPTGIISRFANQKNHEGHLNFVSLGQGQGPRASALVHQCSNSGEWVVLQNCHLAKSWMTELEKICMNFTSIESKQEMNDTFRLFLTSFPTSYFPVSILQISVKVTNEPPKGIQPNLLRSYENLISDEFLERTQKPSEWQKLVFGLCLYHAVVQERRKFGPIGWNITYHFNDSDLETALSVLERFLNEQAEIPWDALHYVTGQINYGGRVTDEFDRRCLMSILERFYSPSLLQYNSVFINEALSTIWRLPDQYNSYSQCVCFLKQLPTDDTPEIFGMHENANIIYRKKEAIKLINSLFSIEPLDSLAISSGSNTGNSSDDIVLELVNSLLSTMPKKIDKKNAPKKSFMNIETGHLNSLSIVLSQETIKFNNLIEIILESLVKLKQAIKGVIVMSNDLDAVYKSVLRNAIPECWLKVSFASLKPLASWFDDLLIRIKFMKTWLEKGQPTSFPLPVFFFPQGFLTGVLQNHSRRYQIPINNLEFSYAVQKVDPGVECFEPPTDGIVVNGLFLQGCSWDSEAHTLQDSKPGQTFIRMQSIHFLPKENQAKYQVESVGSVEHKEEENRLQYYACPIYKTSIRKGTLSTTGISTNFVITVDLPTKKLPSYWILNGAAMLCNLDD